MNHRIKILPEKKFIGKSAPMSLIENTTHQLWKSFRIESKLIHNVVGTDFFQHSTLS